MAEAAAALNDQLFLTLQKENFVILNTTDAQTGAPGVNAISWVYAKDKETIRFAVDGRSRIIDSIKANPQAAVSVFADGTLHAVSGIARIVTEDLAEVPFKLACIDLHVREVRDAMFYGGRISVYPEYEKTYDRRAADKLDGQVFLAMKKA